MDDVEHFEVFQEEEIVSKKIRNKGSVSVES